MNKKFIFNCCIIFLSMLFLVYCSKDNKSKAQVQNFLASYILKNIDPNFCINLNYLQESELNLLKSKKLIERSVISKDKHLNNKIMEKYTITELGRQIQSDNHQLCFAKVSLESIIKVNQIEIGNNYNVVSVLYKIKVGTVASWINETDIKIAFPQIDNILNNPNSLIEKISLIPTESGNFRNADYIR